MKIEGGELARFVAKVRVSKGCWIWTASRLPQGYGQFAMKPGQSQLAHRISFETFRGPIPDGLEIDHLCRNKRCVNPDHLEPVTRRENTNRGARPLMRMFERNARTHCKNGHEYTTENSLWWFSCRVGYKVRHCRSCVNSQKIERRRRGHQPTPVSD